MFLTGDRGERNSSFSKIRVQAADGAVPGLRTRAVWVGRVLGLRGRAVDDQPTSSSRHVQDGTGLGPGCCRRPRAQGPRSQWSQGGWRFDYASTARRSHKLDSFHDRRKSVRYDQRKLAQMIIIIGYQRWAG